MPPKRDLTAARPVFTNEDLAGATAGQWQAPTPPAPPAVPAPAQAAPAAPAPQVQETAATPATKGPRLKKDGSPWGKTGPSKSAVPVKACNVSLPEDLWDALDAEVAERAKKDRRFNRSTLIEEIVRAWDSKQKAKRAA